MFPLDLKTSLLLEMKCLLRCVITICWVMILYGSQKKNRVLFLSHVQLPEVVLIKDEDSETEQIVDEGERKSHKVSFRVS